MELSLLKSQKYKEMKLKERDLLILYLTVKVNGDRAVPRKDLIRLANLGIYRSKLLDRRRDEDEDITLPTGGDLASKGSPKVNVQNKANFETQKQASVASPKREKPGWLGRMQIM